MNANRHRLGGIVLIIFSFMLAYTACTAPPPEEVEVIEAEALPPGDDAQTFVFECGEDYSFVARIEGEKAWLFLPARTVPLPHVPSGSGAKYSDGELTFWSKGEEALLILSQLEQYNCRNNRVAANDDFVRGQAAGDR